MRNATEVNVAIIRAFGLDPAKIKAGGVWITLDQHRGPVIIVEMFRFNDAGEKFVEDGEVATTLKQFELVEIVHDQALEPVDDRGRGHDG